MERFVVVLPIKVIVMVIIYDVLQFHFQRAHDRDNDDNLVKSANLNVKVMMKRRKLESEI